MKTDKCRVKECFAYRSERCLALHDTDFKGKPCPFYKEDTWQLHTCSDCYDLKRNGRSSYRCEFYDKMKTLDDPACVNYRRLK